jgi:hypothetical protein
MDRWAENSVVDLRADLPALKQEVRLARELAVAKGEEEV